MTIATGLNQLEKDSFVESSSNSGQAARAVANPDGLDLGGASTIAMGEQTVDAAGTAQALSTTSAIKYIFIKALSGNTGIVYIGSSTVETTDGLELLPGESTGWFPISDVATVYVDADNNDDGVRFLTLS